MGGATSQRKPTEWVPQGGGGLKILGPPLPPENLKTLSGRRKRWERFFNVSEVDVSRNVSSVWPKRFQHVSNNVSGGARFLNVSALKRFFGVSAFPQGVSLAFPYLCVCVRSVSLAFRSVSRKRFINVSTTHREATFRQRFQTLTFPQRFCFTFP